MNNVIKLSELFEIFVGQIDNGTEYFCLNEAGIKHPVKILRMGMFDSMNKCLKTFEEINKMNRASTKRHKSRRGKASKKIKGGRCLQTNDYLICTRYTKATPITGYSLLNTNLDWPTTVSHHFIVLRPRVDILKIMYGEAHVPFFHALLDSIVDKIGGELVCDTNKSKVLNSGILKKYRVCYPGKYEEQDSMYRAYEMLKNNLNLAKSGLNDIKKHIANLNVS